MVLKCACLLVAQLCQTLCEPMDCSSPGSSVLGVLQATILEWVAIPFSRGIFQTQGSNPVLPLPSEPPGNACLISRKDAIMRALKSKTKCTAFANNHCICEMATHSSTLAWKIPSTEEPGGLQSMGSQRVRHD